MEKYDLVKENKTRSVSRVTAKKNIEMLISRIKEANDNPEFLYYIDKAVLFGSYINSDKKTIGDVDIAVYLSPRVCMNELQKLSIKRACNHGITDFFSQLLFAKEEVLRYIKNKKVSISLHDGKEADKESKLHNEKMSYIYKDKHKVIYERNDDSKCGN